ncbi:F-box/LRR-repeat protein At3g58900 [Pyrus x bretschneideri]|uniref:F-box/LRR-repeat protein At3g58900 n=1 Tax=Pyrus x bretschneideri TaxID=225117 RepID=UPI0020304D97|nr:F-box/LRR-repeat protein At3g58900 [Pyrus x bretschneideri]XP_048441432.1 F-box/LRR-repeat protein At3g58900 [Pyrus x bretschneideri]XP_048441433.1 F-box/LRR-repeat protein At3g58900 [Pyrus x bretschneideri]
MGSISDHQASVEDRISELPDTILCHVLSFLETVHAVRTTVLSTRWNNLWTKVPNLHFDYYPSFSPKYEDEDADVCRNHFMTFVDRVLFFRDSSKIQNFTLSCFEESDFTRIDGWLCTATRRNVVKLDFGLHNICKYDRRVTFSFPQSLFKCKTLEVLKLSSNCTTYYPPTSGCFPSLKFLHITLHNSHDTSAGQLISCCPLLEGLTIDGHVGTRGDSVDVHFNISASKLKTLTISLSAYPTSPYNVLINAPNLKSINLSHNTVAYYSFENVSSLVNANIVLEACQEKERSTVFANRVIALMGAISNVKHLSLSGECAEGCCHQYFLPEYFLPEELVLQDCCFWDVLPAVLQISHNLQHLVLEDSTEFRSRFPEHQWYPPECVPVCLFRLKTISIRRFQGRHVEMAVAKYLLKNCKVLSKMAIYAGHGITEEKKLHQVFAMFERGSTTCEVEIIEA